MYTRLYIAVLEFIDSLPGGTLKELVPFILKSLAKLEDSDRKKIWAILPFQIFLSLMDLVGVILLGTVATLTFNIVSNDSRPTRLQLILRELIPGHLSNTSLAMILTAAAVFLLFTKTTLQTLFSYYFSKFQASIESKLATKLYNNILDGDISVVNHDNFSNYQYTLTVGVNRFVVGVIGAVIVEAGAADGVDTMVFAREFPNALIFAVEPVNEQYKYLCEIFANEKNISLFNLAFSDQNGQSEIVIGESEGRFGGMGSSSIFQPLEHLRYFPEITFNRRQKIKTKTLESFLSENSIDFVDLLWLDIQGKEFDVLLASQLVVMRKIKMIHLEISRVKFYSGTPNERDLRQLLMNMGFECVVDRVGAIAGNALFLNSKL